MRSRAAFGALRGSGRIAALAGALWIAACAGGAGQPAPDDPGFRVCSEPRSPMCTREYRPVCATLESGAEKRYSNACTACADVEVVGHREGECS